MDSSGSQSKNARDIDNAGNGSRIDMELYLLNLIYDNCTEELTRLKLQERNLNYLHEFKHIPIDVKITPLILACYLGRFEIVKMMLVNPTVDIDHGSEDSGFTPLMVSCMSGYYEIASLLIAHGADVNKQTAQGSVPLLYCFTRLEEDSNHFENKRICMKMAELLFENGADIDGVVNTQKGYTMLMVFCGVKYNLSARELEVNLSMIRFLLEHGANRRLLSAKGKTCVQLAEKHQSREQVLHLLDGVQQKYYHDIASTQFLTAYGAVTAASTALPGARDAQARLSTTNPALQAQRRSHAIKDDICQLEGQPRPNEAQCCTLFDWVGRLFARGAPVAGGAPAAGNNGTGSETGGAAIVRLTDTMPKNEKVATNEKASQQ